MTAKRGDRGAIEEVSCIQSAVAPEVECRAVNVVRAAFGDGIDNTARTPSVLGGISAGQDRELSDRVDAEVDAQRASRAFVRVIVDYESIHHEHIRRGAAP